VIDDDLQILPLLQKGLAFEGFEVYTAVDGETGLAAAKHYQPHLVLLVGHLSIPMGMCDAEQKSKEGV